MTTGLFTNRTTSGGRAFAAYRAKTRRATIDAFADHLAEHGDVRRAAAQCGVSASYGRVLFARVKKLLGSQAQ